MCNFQRMISYKMRTPMQGASRQSLELGETVEEIAMRVSGWTGDVVQLLYVSRTDAEREHGRARVLQEIGGGSRIAAVAEAIGYQKHHLVRLFATLLEDRLEIEKAASNLRIRANFFSIISINSSN